MFTMRHAQLERGLRVGGRPDRLVEADIGADGPLELGVTHEVPVVQGCSTIRRSYASSDRNTSTSARVYAAFASTLSAMSG